MEKCSTFFFKRRKVKRKLTVVENDEIISGEDEIAKIFKNYFDKIVGNFNINQNLECFQKSFKEDLVLVSIEKYATHSSIKNIKSRMNGINSNFLFRFVDQDQGLKKLKSQMEIKITKKMVSLSK